MEVKPLRLNEYITESMIFIGRDYSSQDELFEEVYQQAFLEGYVRQDFFDRICAREEEFPTGIQLEDFGVAIPHTDAECVYKEFVAVITNRSPVQFLQMDDKNQTTDAKIVFVLGLNQPHTQLEMLQTLMRLMQDKPYLKKLIACQEKTEIIELMNTFSH